MSPENNSSSMVAQRLLIAVASVTVIASLVLMAVRISSAMSFAYPMHVITSGWEQESLFSMWKFVYGKDIYTDPYKVPYSIAFFNWLFYESYGTFIIVIKSLFSLSDDWVPTIGRGMTLVGLLCGTLVSYQALMVVSGAQSRALRGLFFLVSVYLMFGPLVGFWGFTIRSDIWGMVLDIFAVLLFWRFYPTRPYTAAVLAATALFCAWSFKQIDVFSAIAIGLFLLFHLRIRVLIVLTAVYFLFVGVVLLVGSEEYIKTIFLRPAIYGFDLEHFSRNLKNFAVKSTPTLFPLVAMVTALVFSESIRKAVFANQAARFVMIGIVPIFILTLLISSKIGAAENYYFAFSFYVALGVAVFLKITLEDEALVSEHRFVALRSAVVYAMLLGWGIAAAAILSVFLGFFGVLSIQSDHDRLSAIKVCLHQMPAPVYNQDMYASLPWMNPSEPPIILSWNYRLERKMGLPFERGGVGGLVESGHFASLLLPENMTKLDGGSLDGYKNTGQTCAGYAILVKK